eukprot:TRINITY_DN60777_c0_g1_i1.p1 TRINITY_DN60777_c0_g1~~TRINITY_DN60777_c0_g1_i1.p1  ORF type:complete len:477 (+),score=47.50 TRINITY_DN60777_c0_g1_i1:61-1491(+)
MKPDGSEQDLLVPSFWFNRGTSCHPSEGGLSGHASSGSLFLSEGSVEEPLIEEHAPPEHDGTIIGSILALVLTSVGSGAFAIPYAFSQAGVGLGTLLAVITALLSFLSAHALILCSDAIGSFTYGEIVQAAWGTRGAFLVEMVVVLLLLGAMSALLSLIRDSVPAMFHLLLSSQRFSEVARYKDCLVLSLVAFVMIPLSCFQSLNALKHSNAVAVICVFFAIFYVVGHGALTFSGGGGLLAYHPAYTDPLSAVQAVPILMLSFCMHVQAPPIYGELRDRAVGRFSKVLAGQTVTVLIIYLAMGVFGLRLFDPDAVVPSDVLLGFSPDIPAVLCVRVAVGWSCISVFPLLCMPCRLSVDHLILGDAARNGSREESHGARVRRYSQTVVIVLFATALSYGLKDLGKITALTGAFGGTILCFVVPMTCFIKLHGRGQEGPYNLQRCAAEVYAIRVGFFVSCLLTIVAMTTVANSLLNEK